MNYRNENIYSKLRNNFSTAEKVKKANKLI